MILPLRSLKPWLAAVVLVLPSMAADISGETTLAWDRAAYRSERTHTWLENEYPSVYDERFPTYTNLNTGAWVVATHNRDWRAGFWPGTLWFLAGKTGSELWKQRAAAWSETLATSENTDHDIGFIVMSSVGKGWLYHDDLSDPGGSYREFARQALTVAADKLNSRFNMPNIGGVLVPANMTRSWDHLPVALPGVHRQSDEPGAALRRL